MDTKALRQKILDLAIRGKLVPQNPNDEPASALLEKIREQKQQMYKEGKLKKKDIKNDSIIFKDEDNLHYEKFQDGTVKCIEDEIPFEVPEGWCWSRLISLSSIITDGEHKTPRRVNEFQGYYLLSARNIQNGFLSLTDVDFVDKSEFENISRRCNPKDNDVLISCSGSIGRVTVVNDGNNYVMVRSAAMVRPISINPHYLMFALQSGQLQTQMQKVAKQTAQANLFLGAIQSLLIPLPPETECYRIVLAIDNFLKIIDFISSEQDRLSELVSTAKAKILDLAIRGKFVPQNPDDEPASILLERIRAEKEELIKQGQIKRNKKESVIFKGEDNSYYETISNTLNTLEDSNLFDLPDNWCWCRVHSIADVKGGKRLPKGCSFSDTPTDHAYIRVADMKDQTVNINELKYISDEVYEQIKSYIISKNDLYVTIAGTIGVVGEIPDELDNMNLTENAAKLCNIKIDKKYLCYILSSWFVQNQFQEKTHQVAMPKLALERILTTIIPVPPYKEQVLIVKKVENALSKMNTIEKNI